MYNSQVQSLCIRSHEALLLPVSSIFCKPVQILKMETQIQFLEYPSHI